MQETIKRLERELADRDRDIRVYKSEMGKLNAKISELIDHIENQLKLASRIQKALVPTEIPKFPGFEFSTKYIASSISGGDYFDIFSTPSKTRFGVLLSASSGFGMSALLLSVLIKLGTQVEGSREIDSAEALHTIAKDLVSSMTSDDAANVFMAFVNRAEMTFTYAGAGEILAIYVPKESDAEIIEIHSQPVIHSRIPPFTDSVIDLHSRDRIVLISPGIFRTVNRNGEEMGRERILSLVDENKRSGAHELRNSIMFGAQHFAEGQESSRDSTVIVMDVKDRVLKIARR
ncbi:MAG: SpoIIE family protein phosphatase [Bdellovibrionales bacterium]|nr:SpoIIE family protein phosphatase [Bdellovibrionales bacterium]